MPGIRSVKDYIEEKHSRPKLLIFTGAGRGRGVAVLTKPLEAWRAAHESHSKHWRNAVYK
jgi:hypothetical protein